MKSLLSSLLHLLYPHTCDGCGMELTDTEQILCIRCHKRLPFTGYQLLHDNPVEKIFWGRVNIRHAMAACYYRKNAFLQQLIYQFKYKQREDIATYFGRLMGHTLRQSSWLYEIDTILPIPMHPSKIRRRGYNQAMVLANGVAVATEKTLSDGILVRHLQTTSQTNKGRLSRWQNVSDSFLLHPNTDLKNKHILLVDDVITTGATLEACSRLLVNAGAAVSICALAYARH